MEYIPQNLEVARMLAGLAGCEPIGAGAGVICPDWEKRVGLPACPVLFSKGLGPVDASALSRRSPGGFSRAEIETVVKSAIESAFVAGKELTADDLVNFARRAVPISHTMADKINELRT